VSPETINDGTITSPQGFLAGATFTGLKEPGPGKLDLGLLYSTTPCTAVGFFTQNQVKAAPVIISQRKLENGSAQAVVINAGNANACTGEQGLADAEEMATLAGRKLNVDPSQVLAASTGVIGVPLPMEKIRPGFKAINPSEAGGHELARAITTTDTFQKEIAVITEIEGQRVTVAGIAKGAGMIHPQMATLLSFITTDAALDFAYLEEAVEIAVEQSFNMISIDADTSTNDTLIVMANGQSGNRIVKGDRPGPMNAFQDALNQVCLHLAKAVASDGEGATKLLEIRVKGAATMGDARRSARTISSSYLVKSAMYGNDPNWGRILAAAGRSGADVDQEKVNLHVAGHHLMQDGHPLPFDRATASAAIDAKEVIIELDLGLGDASATAWGCDLSEEYVTFNSAYTT
jgi:glutamate N-acetyltransferase/amino-acid N-acetyltransferase